PTRPGGVAIRIPTKGGTPRVYRLPTMAEVPTAIRGKLPPVERVIGLDVETEFLYVTTPSKDSTPKKKPPRAKPDPTPTAPKSDVLALDPASARNTAVPRRIDTTTLGPAATRQS